MNNNNGPEKKFAAGAISATVWQNTAQRDGKPQQYKTVSFQRSYKDGNGKWQNTGSLRMHDLPKALAVLKKAYEYMIFGEEGQEKKVEHPPPPRHAEQVY